MKKYLLLCDLFGQTPGFYINDNKELKSYLGGIITLIIISLSIIMGIILGKEILQKKKPSVNLITESYESPKKINYFDNYEVLLSINNLDKIPEINEQIYYAKANLFKTIVNSSGSYSEYIDLKMTRCIESMKNSNNYNLVKELDLYNFYCLDKNNKDLIYINEFWGNNNFQMIQIKLYTCNNDTMNNTCASELEINTFLKNPNLQLYLIDTYANTNNYKQPFQKILRDKYYYVSNTFFVSLTEYIHHVNIRTDKGLIFNNYNEKNNFTIDSIIDYTIYSRNDTILSFSIQLNNVIEKYRRSYYKFQDLAAEVGGIYSILSIIFFILLRPFSENLYFEYLINNFFHIVFFNKADNNNKNFNNKSNNLDNITKINETLPTETNRYLQDLNRNKNKNKQKIFSEKLNYNYSKRRGSIIRKMPRINVLTRSNTITKPKETYKIKLNILDKFNIYYCRNKEKKNELNLFKIGKKHLKNYLEITNFVNIYHSNHVFMDLLFSENQQSAFSFVSEPILSFGFIGSRYNSKNIPKKIKKKLFTQIID